MMVRQKVLGALCRIVCVFLFALLVLDTSACREGGSQSDGDADGDADGDGDGDADGDSDGDADGDPPTCSGCREDQVCVEGVCTDVPSECPCPTETYCDLTTNTCVVGCLDDSYCSTGRICNADSRQCFDGCRDDSGCGSGRICEDLSCISGCRVDGDCGDGSICEGLECRVGCREDGQCGDGEICADLSCRAGCRVHTDCPSEQACDPAALVCRAGCRDDDDCGLGTVCDGTSLECIDGCYGDDHCPDGEICDSGTCRVGCRLASDCGEPANPISGPGEGNICNDDNECEPFVGSGRCFRDNHCEAGEACDLESLRCYTVSGLGSCSDWCHHSGCYSGAACANGTCIDRDVGARCASGIWCGLNRACSDYDFTCYNLYCDDGCGPAMHCTTGSTCQASTSSTMSGLCFDGELCYSDSDCTYGGECTGSTCSFYTSCTTSANCDSGEYVCSEGQCMPFFWTPCTDDSQCDRAHLTCDEGLGTCVYVS